MSTKAKPTAALKAATAISTTPASKAAKPTTTTTASSATSATAAPKPNVPTPPTTAPQQPKYQKKTQLEHILLRPDTYIGSVEREEQEMWVFHDSYLDLALSTHMDDSDDEDDDEEEEEENASSAAVATKAKKSKAARELPVPTLVEKKVHIVPGLFKIFDEILVNAADNKQRDAGKIIMNRLEVNIDAVAGSICIKNNGAGISTAKHDEYPMHIPQLIFGELLTSSNYNDNIKQTVGGRNGFGAKLANIFSTRFRVEIDDAVLKKSYRQEWTDNMSKFTAPTIKAMSRKSNSTSITFWPDWKRFGLDPATKFTRDMLQLFVLRVFDIAGTTPASLRVTLNGHIVPIKGLVDYAGMYGIQCGTKSSETAMIPAAPTDASVAAPVMTAKRIGIHEQISPRWEIVLSTNLKGGQADHVAFVNNISTTRGGTHVKYVLDVIVDAVLEKVQKVKGHGNALKQLKAIDVRRHLFVIINSLIVNPTFDTQTKTYLTTKQADLDLGVDKSTGQTRKEKFALTETFLRKLDKSGIVQTIVERITNKQVKELAKQDKKKSTRLIGIAKLEDANEAGTATGHLCTLILTEGDSAKALAVSGLAVVGRNRYGVFPLKGKLLNVRDASPKQIMDNDEITHLKQIVGLKTGDVYTDAKSLRYGVILIMADQDEDAFHIKGLVMNVISFFWPSAIQNIPGFIRLFNTPIVGVSKASKELTATTLHDMYFYRVAEYLAWRRQMIHKAYGETVNLNSLTPEEREALESKVFDAWVIKHYKGLGTSTAVEGKKYFSDLVKHVVIMLYAGPKDYEAIDLAFAKSKADARKEWLIKYDATLQQEELNEIGGNAIEGDTNRDTYMQIMPDGLRKLTYESFVDNELIQFSRASNIRAISSAIDGLKPSLRKILWYCMVWKVVRLLKVEELIGHIMGYMAYHHGPTALEKALVGLAQDFVGSNNINFLVPKGAFGTRAAGGKDAASGRYIETALAKQTRTLFPEDDDGVLRHVYDDGKKVQPECLVPVIPLVLVNGSSGIGTGWSHDVPACDPRIILTIVFAILQCLRDELDLTKEKEEAELRAAASSTSKDLESFEVHEPKLSDDRENDPVWQALCSTVETSVISNNLRPYARGFQGSIRPRDDKSWVTTGIIDRYTGTTASSVVILHIRELPIGEWTQDYKIKLETMITDGLVSQIRENHTDHHVSFLVDLSPEQMAKAEASGSLYRYFKLTKSITTTNMNLYDAKHRLKHFPTLASIILEFVPVRYETYRLRKARLIDQLKALIRRNENKLRFAEETIKKVVDTSKSRKALVQQLYARNYLRIPTTASSIKTKKKQANDPMDFEEEDYDEDVVILSSSSSGPATSAAAAPTANVKISDYEYLLSMQISSLTSDMIAKRRAQIHAQYIELRKVVATSVLTLWERDANAVGSMLDKLDATSQDEYVQSLASIRSLVADTLGISVKKPASKAAAASSKRKLSVEEYEANWQRVPESDTDFPAASAPSGTKGKGNKHKRSDDESATNEDTPPKAKKIKAIKPAATTEVAAAPVSIGLRAMVEEEDEDIDEEVEPGDAPYRPSEDAHMRDDSDDDEDRPIVSSSTATAASRPIRASRTNRSFVDLCSDNESEEEGEEEESESDTSMSDA